MTLLSISTHMKQAGKLSMSRRKSWHGLQKKSIESFAFPRQQKKMQRKFLEFHHENLPLCTRGCRRMRHIVLDKCVHIFCCKKSVTNSIFHKKLRLHIAWEI